MRVALRFFLFLIPVIALAVLGSLKMMSRLEQKWLLGDLSRRSKLIAESTHDYLSETLGARRLTPAARLLDRISRDERLIGAILCSPEGNLLAKSKAVPKTAGCDQAWKKAQGGSGQLVEFETQTLYEAAFPIESDKGVLGYLVLFHDTTYMSERHGPTKTYAVILLVGLSLLFFLITLAVYRWSMNTTINKLKAVFRGVVTGDIATIDESVTRGEFSPIARDLSKVLRELRHAKEVVKDTETALSWTPTRLRTEVQKLFGDSQLCVIANREPYVHNKKGNKLEVLLPASGLVTAVEPIVRACSGLWIGHGSGTADRETADASGKLLVPPGKPEYVLKRVWLSKAEEKGYYYGFSNEGLWPLCHIAHTRPHFDSQDWNHYVAVNEKFAKSFAEEQTGKQPILLIQDYHFALLPEMVRKLKPEAVSSLFWHIPWPNPEAFGICPWKKELLRGMLGADLIGFHTQFHCNNFLDTVDRFLEARVDRERFSVTIRGHTCFVKPFSISVEWPPRYDLSAEELPREKEELLSELNLPKNIKIGIGVDRVDYTKGIIERFRSVEKLLDKHPELVGKFVFVQIGAPSRTHIKRYQDLNSEVQELANQINWKFHKADVPPILLKLSHHNAPDLFRYYRAADVCFVSSLHDGMNLVAKEYIAAHNDNDGVLVLSNFAGASRELTEALIVNPYDIDECAAALHTALTMPEPERKRRMERLRAIVSEKNVYAWAGSFLAEINRIAQLKGSPT